jgi:integrase/recombinase XerD
MGVSIKLKSKVYKDGTSPVMIRIYHEGKEAYKKTHVNIDRKFWDAETSRVAPSSPNAKNLNLILQKKRIDYEQLYYAALASGSKTEIDSLFVYRKKVLLFEDLYESYFEKIEKESVGYRKKVRGILDSMKPYFVNVRYNDIDRRFIEKLVTNLRVVSKNSNNTINYKIKKLREVVQYGLDNNVITNRNPFVGFRVKSNVIIKDSLTVEQLFAVEGLDLSDTPGIECSRDTFLMQYYLHGSRVADVLMLQVDHIREGFVRFQQRKTGAEIQVEVHDKIVSIVNKYRRPGAKLLFPTIKDDNHADLRAIDTKISNATALMNKNLKKIAKRCGIETNLSSHIARHSFANHADLRGISVRVISKALGHSSIQTTEKYLAKVKANRINEQVNALVYYNSLKDDEKK